MPNVLVVEDENIVAMDIEQTLVATGHFVPATVATGEDAIRGAVAHRPDLVLMDIRLRGDMDGIEAALRIRELVDVPVIFLTANADVDTIARAKLVQPFGYVVKPWTDRELRSAIEVALHRHAMEKQLRDRERWFSTTLRSITDGVIATDTELRVSFLNAVAERLTGWEARDAIGRSVLEVYSTRDPLTRSVREPPVASAGVAASSQSALLVARDGRELPIEQSAAPILGDEGAPMGVVLVFRDVTERRQIEERLAVSARLASLGTLVAGAAHEINNPLTYNLANILYARRTIPELMQRARSLGRDGSSDAWNEIDRELADVLAALTEASEGGERVKRLVQDLKSFSRPAAAANEPVELAPVIETAIRMVWNEVRHRSRFEKKLGPAPRVFGNASQIEQVLTNLLLNAAQSIQGGVDVNLIRITLGTDTTGAAVIEVADTGVGMGPEVLARIFDPFFTTKPVGSGTGLGLSIAHSLVRAHGGELSATSAPGKGSTFFLRLPAHVVPAKPAGRGRVLVVDDEPSVGRSIARAIGARHEVTVVASAEEALPLIRSNPGFDVVITDLMMPGMSGMMLYRRIEEIAADRANSFLFLTGGAFTPESRAFVDLMTGRVIDKPFDIETLSTLVDERRRLRPP